MEFESPIMEFESPMEFESIGFPTIGSRRRNSSQLTPSMDPLIQVLINTLNKDKSIRESAELALGSACSQLGYTPSLLRLSGDVSCAKEVRQAASIALKNVVRRNWEDGETDPHVPEQDKAFVKSEIFRVLGSIRADNESVRKILAECVGLLVGFDYPARWVDFVPKCMEQLLANEDADKVHGALLGLRRAVKRFEYKRRPRKAKVNAAKKISGGDFGEPDVEEEDGRYPLNVLVQATFPVLLKYAGMFVESDEDLHGFMLRLVAKIFASVTRMELPPHLHDEVVIKQWFTVWERVVSKPLNARQSAGDDLDDLSLRPWWKVKKCALEIAVQTFNQCQKDPNFVSDDEKVTEHFVKLFVDGGIAGSLLIASTSLLEGWAKHEAPLPSRVLQLCLSYCSIALEPSKTYKIIRPHLQFLVDDVVLKCLSFTKKDQEYWHDEPEAYAAHDLNPLDDPFDPKASACDLLCTACRLRAKDVLDGVVQFLIEELTKRSSAAKQDACLFAVGALAEILAPPNFMDAFGEGQAGRVSKRAAKYKGHLESMIGRFVVPELRATEPHLRARAAWVIGRYAHLEWKDVSIAQAAFGGLLDRLGDAELPVQSQVASSLKNVLLLDPEESLAAKTLREMALPHLPVIVQKYLYVMSKIGADDVVAGLQAVIAAFDTEISPMAAEVCQALVQAFMHYSGLNEDDDEDGEYAAAAYETMDAINSLMEAAAKTPGMMAHMEPVVMPLLTSIVNPESQEVMDFFETSLTTLSFLTYYNPVPMSNDVWSFVGRLKACYDDFAFDYLSDMCAPIETLAFREPQRFFFGSDEFTHGVSYAMVAYEMCRKVMEDVDGENGSDEVALRSTITLLCALLQSAPENAGQKGLLPIKSICNQSVYWLFTQKHTKLSGSTRSRLFEVVESCFLNSPMETRAAFGANLMFGLQALKESLPSHKLVSRKKIAALGLTSLLRVLAEEGDVVALAFVVTLCAEVLSNIEQQKEFEINDLDGEEDDDAEEIHEEGDEADEDQDGEVDEDEDAQDEEDEAFKNFLKANGDMGGAWGNLDGQDEEEEEEEMDDDFPWPLRSIDENETFSKVLSMAYDRDRDTVQSAILSLTPSVQEAVKRYSKFAFVPYA